MRIGVIAYPLDRPARGGIERYVHRLAEHFARESGGHTFVWIHGQPFAPSSPLVGAQEVVLPEVGLAATLKRRRWGGANPARLDLLFGPYFGLIPGPFAKVVAVPDLYQFESFDVGVLWTLRFRAATRRIVPQADLVITGSQAARAQIQRHFALPESRIALVPYGVDAPAAAPAGARAALRSRFGWGADDPVVLFVGAVIRRKDPLTLFHALAGLRQRLPNARLLVIGPHLPHSRPILRGLARLNLGASVQLTGASDEALLELAYHGADAFALPSRFEGFGIPVLEAMAHGLPCVVSTGGALLEVAADAALTFAPGDGAALEAHLERLLSDGALRSELAAKGRARATQFSWRRCARETLRALEVAAAAR